MSLAIAIVSAVLPSMLILRYFVKKDRFPEPRRVVLTTFAYGVLVTIPVVAVALPLLLFVTTLGLSPWLVALATAVLGAAIPEESFKYLVLRGYAMRHSEFDEPMDGLVYGVSASLGFATLENILYVMDGGLTVALTRAVTAVPLHAMFGAIMGYYAAESHFLSDRSRIFLRRAWAVPVILHAAYDFPLMVLSQGEAPVSGGLAAVLIVAALAVLLVSIVWAMRLAATLRRIQDQTAARMHTESLASPPDPSI